MPATERFRESWRIVWAIASKDILDALRNKTTLSTILTLLFMLAAYRMLPSWESASLPPRMALFDAGGSRLVAELENSAEFDMYLAGSRGEMEAYVGTMSDVVLGLVLPADFDRRLASDEQVDLDGYVVHWAGGAAAADVQAFFEEQLTRLAGQPVRVNVAGNIVYTQKNSRGYALLAALSVIIAIVIVGVSLVPHIMLEEKRAKTMDALLVAPVSASHVVAGKALTGLFYCLTATGVALGFNAALINHWGLAVLAAICGSLFTVALGLLAGSTIETRGQLTLWAWLLLIPLLLPVFLSIMVDILPANVIKVLGWVPTVALSKVLRVSFSNRAPLADFGPDLVLVVVWAVLVLVAVVWVVRRSDR